MDGWSDWRWKDIEGGTVTVYVDDIQKRWECILLCSHLVGNKGVCAKFKFKRYIAWDSSINSCVNPPSRCSDKSCSDSSDDINISE